MTTVGFIGLGNMGSPMVDRLLAAGFSVMVNDADPDAVRRSVSAGAAPAQRLEDLAECDLVVLMLPTSDVVDEVVRLLLPHLKGRGTLLVDMGSSEPLRTQALAGAASACGVRVVDAPVSGGVKGAVNGTLTIMAGGSAEDVTQARPVLSAMGRNVTHVGAVGAGHALKSLNNLLNATHLIATAEAMVVAARFGIDSRAALEVINASTGRSASTEYKFPTFVLPRTFDSGFTASLLAKDVAIAVSLADELAVTAPVSHQVLTSWRDALDELRPGADHTEVVTVYERQSGVVVSS